MTRGRLLLVFLLIVAGAKTGFVQASDLSIPIISSSALSTNRLFFTDAQRQEGDGGSSALMPNSVDTESALAASTELIEQPARTHNLTLRYTGLIRSVRGLQILLNGLPWRSGDFNVIGARLQLGTDLLEVTLRSGKRYQLAPGETIELAL